MKTTIYTRRGSVLLFSLIFAVVLGVMLCSVLNYGITEKKLNAKHAAWVEARYAAETILEYGAGEMYGRIKSSSYVPDDSMLSAGKPLVLPPASFFSGGNVDYSSLQVSGGRFSASQTVTLPMTPATDPLKGQTVVRRSAPIFAKATVIDPATRMPVTCWASTVIQIRKPQWFDGLSYYLPDMEIAPGPTMDYVGGLKTAGDLYYQCNIGSTLDIYGRAVAQGNLYHGRKPGSGQSSSNGFVGLTNSAGSIVPFDQSGSWVTSSTSNFATVAMNLWGGNLLTGAMGATVPTIAGFPNYTPYSPTDPNSNAGHQVIEAPILNNAGAAYQPEIETGKMAVKAGLVISVSSTGTVTAYKYAPDSAGLYSRKDENSGVITTYTRQVVNLPSGMVSTTTMGDKRRGISNVKIYDVDIASLCSAINTNTPASQITGGYTKSTDWNGIVYVELASPSTSGVRVVNGSQIPNFGSQAGLTFSTNAPLYVKGNFNSNGTIPANATSMGVPETNEAPAALIADAITILSNNWNDANSNKALSCRTATPTVVSAALVGGIVPSAGNKYSGGFENYPRFLESWSGVKFGYRGAVVALFDSEIATQPWGGSDVYSPPVRVWAYNQLFQTNTPAFAPRPADPNRIGFTEYNSQSAFDSAVAAAL